MLVKTVLSDPAQRAGLATDPDATLKAAAATAIQQTPEYFSDPWVYRIVVGALSLTVLCVIAAYVYLDMIGRNSPEALVAIGAGALGGLTGLLAPTPGQKA
jgi:hypothetical protein